jgi:hypothetical protein
VRVSVLLIVSTAFGRDGFDLRNAVLDCFFIGYANALALDLALRHALPHELYEDIGGQNRGSFTEVRKRSQHRNLHSG